MVRFYFLNGEVFALSRGVWLAAVARKQPARSKNHLKVQAAFATGGNPKARVWRRNAMNTAGNPVPEREAQPAESALYRIILP